MDLYYRLHVIPVEVPLLRARREDIPALAAHFVATFARQFRRRVNRISDVTMRQLTAYHWPGNIRELQNFLARAVVLSTGEVLDASLDPGGSFASEADPPRSLEDAERRHIEGVLKATRWVVERPARRRRHAPDERQHAAQHEEAAGYPASVLAFTPRARTHTLPRAACASFRRRDRPRAFPP